MNGGLNHSLGSCSPLHSSRSHPSFQRPTLHAQSPTRLSPNQEVAASAAASFYSCVMPIATRHAACCSSCLWFWSGARHRTLRVCTVLMFQREHSGTCEVAQLSAVAIVTHGRGAMESHTHTAAAYSGAFWTGTSNSPTRQRRKEVTLKRNDGAGSTYTSY